MFRLRISVILFLIFAAADWSSGQVKFGRGDDSCAARNEEIERLLIQAGAKVR